jgi:anti-sigma regulatory factor (Ser/Thr protein kinase)
MDPRTARIQLAHDVGAPRAARRFLAEVLPTWGVAPEAVERSQLLVSELVSNAIMHGRAPVTLIVSETDPVEGVYRVEVCNDGEGVPSMRSALRDDLSGRGLRLVDQLALEWGSNSSHGQTRVWFDVGAVVAC